MHDMQKYLEGEYYHHLDYREFAENMKSDDDAILRNIERFIGKQVKDILLIKIDEDIFLTEKELKKIPQGVKHYLAYSELRGIKIYVFTTHDGDFRTAIGAFGGTTLRANEWYFDQIINDEKYKNIINTVTIKLSELFSDIHR